MLKRKKSTNFQNQIATRVIETEENFNRRIPEHLTFAGYEYYKTDDFKARCRNGIHVS